MTSVYTTIQTAIENKLQGITGLNVIYKFVKGEIPKYPACIMTGVKIDSTPYSTSENQKVYTFEAELLQELSRNNTGVQKAEEILTGLIDEIMLAFEEDETLGGAVNFCLVSSIFGYESRELPLRIIKITITCHKLVQIRTI